MGDGSGKPSENAVREKAWTSAQQLLQDSSQAVQAFPVAMRLLKSDAGLNVDRLKYILKHLIATECGLDKLIPLYKTFSKHPDLLQHSWIILSELPEETTNEKLDRILSLMSALPITTWDGNALLVPSESFAFDYFKVRKALNICWDRVMRQPLNMNTRKQMLTLLLENMLMHIEKPILLTDFLMGSLDVGGPISLMALQGVFTLIQEHNITYPDIYTKIYFLFEPDIFHTKYKARLFYLTDLFLSSTHLPEALVGAFVKRVARLALSAPPQDAVIALQFISNLIIRHKSLKRLLNDPPLPQTVLKNDPYNMEESDPTKSRALESSLWEVEALTQHVLPNVSVVAKNVLRANARTEFDLGQVLELTESDVSIHFLYNFRSSNNYYPFNRLSSFSRSRLRATQITKATISGSMLLDRRTKYCGPCIRRQMYKCRI